MTRKLSSRHLNQVDFKRRGNSLETPNVWGLSSFHPNVSKQPPPPQCLGFCPLFTPTFVSRRAGSDVDATAAADRRGSHVAAMSAQGKTKKLRRGERIAEGSDGERERLISSGERQDCRASGRVEHRLSCHQRLRQRSPSDPACLCHTRPALSRIACSLSAST